VLLGQLAEAHDAVTGLVADAHVAHLRALRSLASQHKGYSFGLGWSETLPASSQRFHPLPVCRSAASGYTDAGACGARCSACALAEPGPGQHRTLPAFTTASSPRSCSSNGMSPSRSSATSYEDAPNRPPT